MMSGPNQVAQIRNMQAAAQQQALQAQAQQAQLQAQQTQQLGSRPPSSTGSSSQQPHPTTSQQSASQPMQPQGSQTLGAVPMSRVPTVAQQAMLANPNASQMQAQLAAAQGVARQQQQSQQSIPQMNGALNAAQIQQQQQQLYRSQQLTSMAAGLPFDPSMMSGLNQDQLATVIRMVR